MRPCRAAFPMLACVVDCVRTAQWLCCLLFSSFFSDPVRVASFPEAARPGFVDFSRRALDVCSLRAVLFAARLRCETRSQSVFPLGVQGAWVFAVVAASLAWWLWRPSLTQSSQLRLSSCEAAPAAALPCARTPLRQSRRQRSRAAARRWPATPRRSANSSGVRVREAAGVAMRAVGEMKRGGRVQIRHCADGNGRW